MGIPSSDLPPVPAGTTAGKPRSALRCQDSGAATTPRTPPPPLPPPAARKARAGAPRAARPAGGHHPRATRAGRGAGAALPAPAAGPGNATTPIWMTEGFGGGGETPEIFYFLRLFWKLKPRLCWHSPLGDSGTGKGENGGKKGGKHPAGGPRRPFPSPRVRYPKLKPHRPGVELEAAHASWGYREGIWVQLLWFFNLFFFFPF